MLQDQVILIGEFQNQSVLLAVSRDTGDSVVKGLLRSLVEDILAQHGDGAGFCFSKTGQNLNQFRLSVSVDTGQTYNLALAHIQVEAL